MSDVEIRVTGNTDALSESVLHLALVRMVDDAAKDGAEFLRGIVPKESGALAEHVRHEDAVENTVGLIEAKLGVDPVGESHVPGFGGLAISPRFSFQPSDRSHYPLFVDRGTGLYGPAHALIYGRRGLMHYEHDGKEIYARSVRGQRGQHFMAETLVFVRELIKHDHSIREAIRVMVSRSGAE